MNRILVDIDAYLNDCPPWDEPIDESIIPEIAAEIARRFDCTEIYGQIDDLACALLRERNPIWTSTDMNAAQAEGWDIFDCYGSANGPWQLQSFDDPEDVASAPRPYPFQSDVDVWTHVRSKAAQGSPLHGKALAFLAAHNPTEYRSILDATPAPAAAGESHAS